VNALLSLGIYGSRRGHTQQAHDYFERAAQLLAHETGDRNAEFEALHGLGEVLRLARDLDDAPDWPPGGRWRPVPGG
jgi:hypothetical protein